MTATHIDLANDDNPRASTATIAIAFALFWVTLLIHEAAHYAAASIVGAKSALAAGAWTAALQLTVSSAGPIATLVIIVASALLSASPRSARHGPLLLSLAAGAASRFALVAPVILLGRGWNDERSVAASLGTPARLVVAGELVVAAAALAWIAVQIRRRGQPLTLWHTVVGVGLGWATAFTFGRAIGLPI